jgi:hypothetical protein
VAVLADCLGDPVERGQEEGGAEEASQVEALRRGPPAERGEPRHKRSPCEGPPAGLGEGEGQEQSAPEREPRGTSSGEDNGAYEVHCGLGSGSP